MNHDSIENLPTKMPQVEEAMNTQEGLIERLHVVVEELTKKLTPVLFYSGQPDDLSPKGVDVLRAPLADSITQSNNAMRERIMELERLHSAIQL